MRPELKILHVEDDPLDSETVRALLRQEGLPAEIDQVETMTGFQEALEQKPYALILCDHTIPGLDSVEALRWARERHPEVPFIFVSGTIGEEEAIDMLKLGASDYLSKQRLARLGPAVRRALQEAREQASRRQVEAELRKFHFFSENSNDAHVLIDYQARIRYVNKLACDRLGYTREELLRLKIPEIDPVFPLHKVQELFTRLQRGWVPPFEAIHRRKDGSTFPVEITSTVLEVNGEALMFSAVRDITDRKRAERALQLSESRMRAIFEHAGVGIVEVADDDHFIAVNQRACEIVGRSREEMLRLNVHELTWPEDRELSNRLNAEVHAGVRDRAAYEKRYIRGEGSPVWVNVTVVGVRDAEGRWLRSITTVEDISERKRQEARLAEAYGLMRAVTEGVEEAIFVKDRQSRYLMINTAGAKRLGKASPQEVLHKADAEFLPTEEAATIRARDHEVMASGRSQTYEEVRLVTGARRVFLTSKAPYCDPESNIIGVLGISHDITERKQTEEALREARTSLERTVAERTAQLVEANANLRSFAHTAAHDLRSPLRGISSFSSVFLEDYGARLDETARSYLERINQSAGQMGQLLNDLLEYSRINEADMKLEPVSLQRAVQEALALLETEIRSKGADVAVEESLPEVIGHPATVTLIINNYVSNALKFVPPDVRPQIRIRAESRGAVENGRQGDAGLVRLWVQDNGIGIRPEDVSKLFGVFQRLHGKQAYPGTGLGLAIVRRGAERMRGRAGVESEPGRGSRFWMELRSAETWAAT